jgi:predicted amidohydrolase
MSFKLELVQFAPKLFAEEENCEFIYNKVNKSQSDIIVFPELATSGYYYLANDEIPYKESVNLINRIKKLVEKENKLVIFGYPEKANNIFYNSAIAISNGFTYNYRKSHLFYKEKFIFQKGDTGFSNIRFTKNGIDINLGIIICYDWRFPEVTRKLAFDGADIIINCANLVTKLWQSVIKARAIENKTYYAVANRIGIEERQVDDNIDKLEFTGESVIFDYFGNPLAIASKEMADSIIVEIYPEPTRDKSINPYNDLYLDLRRDLL